MDRQSLSALVEVERLIAKRELDVDGAMHLIVDSARNVAHATGVAIALLKGEQLVYRAGSGSAATYIGRGVMATLTGPGDNKANPEILRVENAQTDTRIEAAICRQFGAESLLILLIYQDCAVAGVLEILFNEAHAFQDREVRTYRLMAGLIGEVMSQAAQLEQARTLTAKLPTTPRAVEQKFLEDGEAMPSSANHHAIYQRRASAMAVARKLPMLPALLATMVVRHAKRIPWHKPRWNVTLAAVAIVLVLSCWTAFRGRRSVQALGPSTLHRSTVIGQQVPSLPAKALPAQGMSKLQAVAVAGEKSKSTTARTAFRRVRVGQNEVDYIAEDVTVRDFTSKPRAQWGRVGERQVAYFGDDVTVRYFTPKPTVMSSAQPLDPSSPASGESVSPKPAK